MITVKTEYVNGEPFVTFELQEYNSKVAKFLLKLGFVQKNKFEYIIGRYHTVEQGDKQYKAIDVANYQLNKMITKVDSRTSFTCLKQSKPYIKLEDGYLKLGYDEEAGRVIQTRMNGWDLTAVSSYLTDLGFANDKPNAHTGFRAFKAVCSVELLAQLAHDNYIRVNADLTTEYTDLVRYRYLLETQYVDALASFKYYGDFTPLMHQWDYLRKATTFGSVMAFDMGCGKTFTSLYQAAVYRTILPDLQIYVVCPKSMRVQWEVQAQEHFGMHVNTATWSSIPGAPSSNKPYMVIFDECHYMADHTNSRSIACQLLAAKAVAVLCLSGTTSKNGRAKELFGILKCVGFPYSVSKQNYTTMFGWEFGNTKMQALRTYLHNKYFYVSKHDVLDLPSKNRVKHLVELDKAIVEKYDKQFSEFMQRYHNRVMEGKVSGNPMIEYLVALQGLRLELAKAKAVKTVELIANLVKLHNKPVAVFSDFNEPLDIISELLAGKHITFTRLRAEDNAQSRYDKQQLFKQRDVMVFLTSFKCGGVGIDLTPCSQLIINDRPYTPGDALQAEDRCHRIGQKEDLTVYWMWWQDPSGVESKIEALLSDKQEAINELNASNISLEYKC